QDRQRKGRSFASAGLSDADDIATLARKGNSLSLNGSGGDVFFFRKGAENRRCEAELVKCSQTISFFYGETAVLPLQPPESRGSQRHPAWPGLSFSWRNGRGGAKFVLEFRARSPQTEIGSFIRWGGYDSRPGAFLRRSGCYF